MKEIDELFKKHAKAQLTHSELKWEIKKLFEKLKKEAPKNDTYTISFFVGVTKEVIKVYPWWTFKKEVHTNAIEWKRIQFPLNVTDEELEVIKRVMGNNKIPNTIFDFQGLMIESQTIPTPFIHDPDANKESQQ